MEKEAVFLLISLIRTVDHQKRPACVCDAALVLVGFLISRHGQEQLKGAANCQEERRETDLEKRPACV